MMDLIAGGKKTEKPTHYGDEAGSWFKNPWDVVVDEEQTSSWFNVPTFPTLPTLPSLAGLEFPLQWAKDYSGHILKPPKVIEPDFGQTVSSQGNVKTTWLGHAGFLVELCTLKPDESPVRILFDPFFSDRVGPSQYTSIPRWFPPPCTTKELPELQYVLISHNHHDHLDLPIVTDIAATRGRSVYFLVPKGVRSTLIASGVSTDQVLEMDWWEEMVLPIPSGNDRTPSTLTFCCVPSQHNSGRGLLDQNGSLWCGWIVRQTVDQSKTVTIYYAGDTGYMTTRGPCPVFKEIGQRYGPIDLSMIPIWRGGSLSFVARLGLRLAHIPYLSALHATPSHALSIHRDVRSRHSLAMHFGTLAGSDAEAVEPLVELEEAKIEDGSIVKGNDDHNCGDDWKLEGGFGWVDIGETAILNIF